ncbi:TonB-dependent receptor plug domain-containing protein [Sphingomonas sp. M1-B02]|uniref:TonB-dependent receptor plug domain-containing protein n=1 Tax=Sphingomonas sp. M1-B02 TaxID=3114300 RepID=UPI0022409002|nr:TonB-dependent receptor [Sphingomonas sp. S6-11]UZK67578.1 TonB-dependent receptor [Sphingomonas sp. S6-11]
MQRPWWVSLLLVAPIPATATENDPQDLSSLSIEELAQLPVSSASKREEPLSRAPTSLYVITDADIARANGTSLPEVLRLAPNLHVERINGTQHTVSARGFAGYETSNKLLVLIDGRSVYSTLHSGVNWDLHSPLLEDLQQIEVISGPGGTLYGPNAVNGVINIMSKSAADTQGALLRGTASANERTAGARYGFALGDSTKVRVYGNYYDRKDMPPGFGPNNDDAIRGWQAGFRADMAAESGHLTVQGDVFDADAFVLPGDGNRGHNLLARWNRTLGEASSLQVQAYYDYSERRAASTADRVETVDLETQYNLRSGAHDLVGGLGIRTTRDEFFNPLNIFQLDPRKERLWIGNGFIQDRFALTARLSVIAGVKVEASTFSGLQVLPNLRLAWQAGDQALLWTSVSRAVRTPSRIDRDLTAPGFLAGAPDFASEKLIAFEAGYRGQPSPATSLAATVYYHHYYDLRSVRFLGAPWPAQLNNDLGGQQYGIEGWVTQQILPWWRVTGGATFVKRNFEVRDGGVDIGGATSLGRDPGYQLSLRSQITLPQGLTLDAGIRAVDAIENPDIDGYVEADARIGWMFAPGIELYVAGDNLLHATHLESNDSGRTQPIERSISVGTRLRF